MVVVYILLDGGWPRIMTRMNHAQGRCGLVGATFLGSNPEPVMSGSAVIWSPDLGSVVGCVIWIQHEQSFVSLVRCIITVMEHDWKMVGMSRFTPGSGPGLGRLQIRSPDANFIIY